MKNNVQENDEGSDLDLIPRKKPSGNDDDDSDLDTVPRKSSIKKEKDDSDNSPGLFMQKLKLKYFKLLKINDFYNLS